MASYTCRSTRLRYDGTLGRSGRRSLLRLRSMSSLHLYPHRALTVYWGVVAAGFTMAAIGVGAAATITAVAVASQHEMDSAGHRNSAPSRSRGPSGGYRDDLRAVVVDLIR